ncbi:MAG: sulfurtransferase TusA family protein [Actinomycetota bacterium]|jgi:TusA-related sulfurtransferase|nr:sulfurtransferase TusA family protein [Actinomycetota bacterium]
MLPEGVAAEPVVPTLVVDASGRFCPGPVIDASDAARQMALGEVFELITTDPGSWRDIPAWCRNTGNALLVAKAPSDGEQEGGEQRYRFVIRRDR